MAESGNLATGPPLLPQAGCGWKALLWVFLQMQLLPVTVSQNLVLAGKWLLLFFPWGFQEASEQLTVKLNYIHSDDLRSTMIGNILRIMLVIYTKK